MTIHFLLFECWPIDCRGQTSIWVGSMMIWWRSIVIPLFGSWVCSWSTCATAPNGRQKCACKARKPTISSPARSQNFECWVNASGIDNFFGARELFFSRIYSSQRCSKIKHRDSAHAGAFAEWSLCSDDKVSFGGQCLEITECVVVKTSVPLCILM